MTVSPINPSEIKAQTTPSTSKTGAKSMGFGETMGAVGAFAPFTGELTGQATGSVNAATVLNAAFTSFPMAAASFSGTAPSWGMASSMGSTPGFYGATAGGPGGMPGLGASYPSEVGGLSGGQAVPGTNLSQFQLMEVMNQNNLKLIELQAMMQSNMQVWNTKSNILSADHRAKMSMIEKFTARG
ncbi:MAG: hypothetical protein Q7S68_02450 [Deltaproteobacteria bacterium]|nr:hypothetical protein [Deltaproteobacteria bacterium]